MSEPKVNLSAPASGYPGLLGALRELSNEHDARWITAALSATELSLSRASCGPLRSNAVPDGRPAAIRSGRLNTRLGGTVHVSRHKASLRRLNRPRADVEHAMAGGHAS